MPTLIEIDSAEDPRLMPYFSMRDAELAQRQDPLSEHAHGGMFIAEGVLVLDRLARSPFPVHSALIAAPRLQGIRGSIDRLPASTPVFIAPPELLNSIVGFNMHRGVLAIGLRPPPVSPDSLLKGSGPVLALEDVNNHDNLGSIFRSAAALGGPGAAVLLSPRCADPLYRKAVRVSMGNVLQVPFARATESEWADLGRRARERGYRVLALTPDPRALDIRDVASGGPVLLLLGAEGPGLASCTMAGADARVRVPMWSGVDSLNLAVAAAVALSHLCAPPRQPSPNNGCRPG